MAKNTPAVQPNRADLGSTDFAAAVTAAATESVAAAIAAYLTNSGLIANAVQSVIADRRAAAIAAITDGAQPTE